MFKLYEDLCIAADCYTEQLVADGWNVLPLTVLLPRKDQLIYPIIDVIKCWQRGSKVALVDNDIHSGKCQGVAAAACYIAQRGSSVYGISDWLRNNRIPSIFGVPYNTVIVECEFAAQDMTEVRLKAQYREQADAPYVRDGILNIIVPAGIGDALWALTKVESLLKSEGADLCDIHVAVDSRYGALQTRSFSFLRRFPFVNSVKLKECGKLYEPGPLTDEQGRYNYLSTEWIVEDGQAYFRMVPNGHLERGNRLEEWLPDLITNWKVMDQFLLTDAEMAWSDFGRYTVFYLGSLSGNTDELHNRGPLWTPEDWLKLIRFIRKSGKEVVFVGADYDRSYFDEKIKPLITRDLGISESNNLIGRTTIPELVDLLHGSYLTVSYQSGVGIMSAYMDRPTVMWWRPDGNSLHPDRLTSFSEKMATAWVPPEMTRYLGAIYSKTSTEEIKTWITKNVL